MSSDFKKSLSIEETDELRRKLGLKPLNKSTTQQKPNAQQTLTEEEKKAKEQKEADLLEFKKAKEKYEKEQQSNQSKNQEKNKKKENKDRKKHKEKKPKKIIKLELDKPLIQQIKEKKKKRKKEEHSNLEKRSRVHKKNRNEEETLKWVQKNRELELERLEEEKRKAEMQAKLLEEQDENYDSYNFSIENLNRQKNQVYSHEDLKGMMIGHGINNLINQEETILTLQDTNILDKNRNELNNSDVKLVSEEVLQRERDLKNMKLRNQKVAYDPYDEQQKILLPQYSIEDEKPNGKNSTVKIQNNGNIPIEKSNRNFSFNSNHDLKIQNPSVISNQNLNEETNKNQIVQNKVQFRKTKKKLKNKSNIKKQGIDDLINELDNIQVPESSDDHGLPSEKKDEKKELKSNAKFLNRFELALERARNQSLWFFDEMNQKDVSNSLARAKRNLENKESVKGTEKILEYVEKSKNSNENQNENQNENENDSDDLQKNNGIVLTEITEFIAAHEFNDQTEEEKEKEKEKEEEENKQKTKKARHESSRERKKKQNYKSRETEKSIENGKEKTKEEEETKKKKRENKQDKKTRTSKESWTTEGSDAQIKEESAEGINEEPVVGKGMAGAVAFLRKRGDIKPKPKDQEHWMDKKMKEKIEQQNARNSQRGHSSYRDRNRGDRFNSKDQNPEKELKLNPIILKYINDFGQELNTKDAYKYIARIFHGKKPGARKQDKLMAKFEREKKIKSMESNDTPLHSLKLLKDQQRQTGEAFITIQGGQTDSQDTLRLKNDRSRKKRKKKSKNFN
ncbi:squamous cell carcinoma antigen recognized by cytotoxic t lymphocytes [Anaeramoeba ignava]|uniref:Squamous cell carcinoma antigen recognized by cytotoxic t lymphocytes n=1 Tax=Anaeramoeba ignava TaxID=1746090 RepID=A0A9Q0LUD9_ANAIG|nr:squamous cell carcinoma antigen recognized by cytotoxic t lymphocytes [Anaeramoeba ignava]